jgi:hypothetical protein
MSPDGGWEASSASAGHVKIVAEAATGRIVGLAAQTFTRDVSKLSCCAA